jgi:hypothetical protein
MEGKNLENINLEETRTEKPEQQAERAEKPERSFDRNKIISDMDAARAKEILGKLSDIRTENSDKERTETSTQKKDEAVSGFLKEALFGKKNIEWVINEVKKTDDPYIFDSFHDQMMEELKKFKENK